MADKLGSCGPLIGFGFAVLVIVGMVAGPSILLWWLLIGVWPWQ